MVELLKELQNRVFDRQKTEIFKKTSATTRRDFSTFGDENTFDVSGMNTPCGVSSSEITYHADAQKT